MERQILGVAIALLTCGAATMRAQGKTAEVRVCIGDTAYAIGVSHTQTAAKTPWTVFSFEVGGKAVRYIWGRESFQPIDTPTPLLIVDPGDAALSDYALVKLVQKKSRRQLPEPLLRDNPYISVDLANFVITTTEDDKFMIRPCQGLEAGEYILLNINQEPSDDTGDYCGYCFTVCKTAEEAQSQR